MSLQKKKVQTVRSFFRSLKGSFLMTHQEQGKREHMEDKMSLDFVGSLILLAVYDGHGGSQCSEFCKRNFPLLVARNVHKFKSTKVPQILKTSLKQLNEQWDKKCFGINKIPKNRKEAEQFFTEKRIDQFEKRGYTSGSTLNAAIIDITKRKVWIINLGDSRSEWKIENKFGSTMDHKMTQQELELKNEKFKCFMEWDKEGKLMRLNGDLGMSRAVGDNSLDLIGCVGRKPDLYSFSFSKSSLDLILASDGLWDECCFQHLLSYKTLKESIQDVKFEDNTTAIRCHIK